MSNSEKRMRYLRDYHDFAIKLGGGRGWLKALAISF